MGKTDSLEEMVRGFLGRRAEKLEPSEIHDLVDVFVSAGRAAVLGHAGPPTRAAEALRTAFELQRAGAAQLAKETRPGYNDCISGRRWRIIQDILDAYQTDLLSIPNVVGYAVGRKWQAGEPTDTPSIIVLVERKEPLDVLKNGGGKAVPPTLSSPDGVDVVTDVYEVGKFAPFVGSGHCIEPVGFGPEDWGTIGLIAKDRRTHSPVALTALHVVPGIDEYPPSNGEGPDVHFASPCTPDDDSSDEKYFLGRLTRGTRSGIDAARIDIAEGRSVSTGVPGIGPVRGWRPLDREGDVGASVRIYGAKSKRVEHGQILLTSASLPNHNIHRAIVADIPSEPGDSGAALIDQHRFVLGLLIGGDIYSRRRWFSPISSVLDTLKCYI